MTKPAVMLAIVLLGSCVEAEEVELGTADEAINLGTPFPAENSGFVRLPGCSGTLMENLWVLTARHCVEGRTPAQVTLTMGSQTTTGAALYLDPSSDVALVRATMPFSMNGSINGFRRQLYPFPTSTQVPGSLLTCRGYGQTIKNNPSTFGTLTTAQLPIRGTNFTYWCGLWSTHFDLAMDPNGPAGSGQFLTFGDSGTSCLNTLWNGSQVVAGVVSSGLDTPCGDEVTDLVSADTFRAFYERIAGWWEQPWHWLGDDDYLTSGPAVASFGPQHIEIYARGSQGRLIQNSASGAQPWSGWHEFAPQVVSSDPAAIARAGNKLDVFVKMYPTDDIRQMSWDDATHTWTGWTSLGGVFTSSPAVSSWGPDRLDVFGRGTAPLNALYHRSLNGSSWSAYWEMVDSSMIESDPAAVSMAPNRIAVFALREGGVMHMITWDGSAWSAWRDLGGVFTSAPTVVSPGPNRLEVYGRGTDKRLYRNRSTDGGATWGVWYPVGPEEIGPYAPDAVVVDGETNIAAVSLTDRGGLWLVTH